jgi:hypothetical protein
MGSFFILGGLAFALAGGLAYYFISKNEEEKVHEKPHVVEQTTTPHEVDNISYRIKTERERTKRRRMK